MPSNRPDNPESDEPIAAVPTFQWEQPAPADADEQPAAVGGVAGGSARSVELAVLSLMLSSLSWLLGPVGSMGGIVLGHIARTPRNAASTRVGDRVAGAGLIIGYSFAVAAILSVQLFIIGMFASVVVFDGLIQAVLCYWCLGYAILAVVLWLRMIATRPRLGRNATVGVIAFVLLFSLLVLGLRKSRDDARENLTIDRLRQLGIFRQEFEQDQGLRD